MAAPLLEDFESGTKGSYATGTVTLASGSWTLDDALLGNLAGDVKHGTAATRIRLAGRVTMNFDYASADTVSVGHATYGSDASGTWGLFGSTDHGASWNQIGASVTTSSTLQTATFAVQHDGAIRFQLRKLDGTSNRINVDDVAITPVAGGGGGGGGGGSGSEISVHTTLGLPSNATTTNANDYLSVKPQYVMSYNSSRKTPNWVSWELDASYLGNVSRTDAYRSDTTLPSGMPQATPADYSGSGWDRGHLCPSADRTRTTTDNRATFFLSNMVPQASNNNGGPWAKLETYERSLAISGEHLFVIAGGIYAATPPRIGNGVAVPSKTWKVVVIVDDTGNVTTATRVIGIIIPNNNSGVSTSASWQQYRVSVRTIESQTGLDFLSDIDPAIQDVVETRVDNE